MAERTISQVLADLRGGPACILEGADVVVTDITVDSREVNPGSIFACVRGEHHDGHDFASDAVAAGASALLVDHPLPLAVAQILTTDVRAATGCPVTE